MSRIGKRELQVPATVTIKNENNIIEIKGPKGELKYNLSPTLEVKVKDQLLTVTCRNNDTLTKALQGTVNSHILNMIDGVTKGFTETLEIVGVGYRFQLKGNELIVNAGYSHPVVVAIPKDLTVEIIKNMQLVITGIDKQRVGEFAAQIRKIRKPEPYKGKGIRYKDEQIRRKEGKKAAK